MSEVAIVAGNGPSVAQALPGRVLESDLVLRTNNFFLEGEAHLGRRVDLAVMGGDPRLAGFMFETLRKRGADYDLRRWTSHNPKVVRRGLRRLPEGYQPYVMRDRHIEVGVRNLIERYQKKPFTGTYAVLAAHAMGVGRILLAGMDFYVGGARYSHPLGRLHAGLLGGAREMRSMDRRQHHPDLDRAIFDLIQKRGDSRIELAAPQPMLAGIADLAGQRVGPAPTVVDRGGGHDWVGHVGLCSAGTLRALRSARRGMRLRGASD